MRNVKKLELDTFIQKDMTHCQFALTNEELIEKHGNWAVTGRKNRERNIITSLDLQSEKMEARVHRLMKKYEQMYVNTYSISFTHDISNNKAVMIVVKVKRCKR